MRHTTLDANDLVEALNQEKHLIQPVTANAHFTVIPGGSCEGAAEYCFAATQASHRGAWSWNGEFDRLLM